VMDPNDAAFFAFHTPKAAAFTGKSATKTSSGQSFDNDAHAQGGFRGRGRGPYFTGTNGEDAAEAGEEEEVEVVVAPIRTIIHTH
jgi:hypothetical protein